MGLTAVLGLVRANFIFAISPVVSLYFSVFLISMLSRINPDLAADYAVYVSVEMLTISVFAGLVPVVVSRLKKGDSFRYLLSLYTVVGFLFIPLAIFIFYLYGLFVIGDKSGMVFRILLAFTLPVFMIELVVQSKLIMIQKTSRVLPVSVLSGIVMLLSFKFLSYVLDAQYSLVLAIYVAKLYSVLALSFGFLFKSNDGGGVCFEGLDKEWFYFRQTVVNSADAIVLSVTFSTVILFSSLISDQASVATLLIVQILRCVVLPYKRMGLGMTGALLDASIDRRAFVKNSILAMSLLSFIFVFLAIFAFLYLSYDAYSVSIVFSLCLIVSFQICLEPICSFYSTLIKGVGCGFDVLRETVIYQWLMCIPLLCFLYYFQWISLVSIWLVMVCGRLFFAYRLWRFSPFREAV